MQAAATYDGSETTGFMSPARDHADSPIDLAHALDLRMPSRYLVRVSGNAFASRGILDGDVLVVDSAVKPVAGSIVVISGGEGDSLLAVMERRGSRLLPRRPEGYADDDTEIWAVAVSLVRDKL